MTDQVAVNYQNRITGYGIKPASWFLANPDNWRIHPRVQRDSLNGVLSKVGWVRDVLVNQRTSELWPDNQRYVETMIDGHLRVSLALSKSDDEPVPMSYCDLTPEEEALILATLDPLGTLAETDKPKLDSLFQQIHSEDKQINKMLDEISDIEGLEFGDVLGDEKYTHTIQAPIYTPKGIKPNVDELFNTAKTDQLIDEIDASTIPEEIKEFLRIAAQRHTILNFKLIAEFYAQSSPDIQRLMENSALVIIDFNRAIELGYIKVSEEIASQYGQDYPDDDA